MDNQIQTEIPGTETTNTQPPTTKKKTPTQFFAVMSSTDNTQPTIQFVTAGSKTELIGKLKAMDENLELQAVFKGKKMAVKKSFNIN